MLQNVYFSLPCNAAARTASLDKMSKLRHWQPIYSGRRLTVTTSVHPISLYTIRWRETTKTRPPRRRSHSPLVQTYLDDHRLSIILQLTVTKSNDLTSRPALHINSDGFRRSLFAHSVDDVSRSSPVFRRE